MPRFLLIIGLLALACRADAQQADSLAALAPDSTRLSARPGPAAVPFGTLQPALSRVAGVQVTPYSGAPGSLAVVRIRGAASLARNPQPLYVVDGIPALADPLRSDFSATGSVSLTYDDLNPLLALPTEDIASVTVLKGPLETARYGEQGQNGVVEIVTRRGQFGQAPRLRYAAAGAVQQARYRYDLLTAREYAELANELSARRGFPPEFSSSEVAALGTGTDWQAELLRPAAGQEHHLSAEAGTATTHGYVGADYLSQQGIIENSRLRRFSLRTNLEQQLGTRLRLQLGVGLSEVAARQPNTTVTADMLLAPPTLPPRDANGQLSEPAFGAFYGNPLRKALQLYEEPRQGRLLSWLSTDYEPLKGLHLSLNAGLEQSRLRLTGHATALSGQLPGGRVREFDATHRQLTLHPALRLERTLAGRHALTARLEAWQQQYRNTAHDREFAGAGLQSASSSRSEVGLRSYQAQAGYSFAGRYEVQGSLRRDGASAFTQSFEWLPAAQATWHVRQESFWGASSRLRRLDAWVGWGRTSNRGLFHDEKFRDPGQFGYGLSSSPEQTTQQEAGLRLELAQPRLELTVAAYQRQTESSSSQTSGFPAFYTLGPVRNRGLEVTAASTWAAGRLRGTTAVMGAFNQNTLAVQVSQPGVVLPGVGFNQRLADGTALSSYYGLRYEGVNPATGQPRYADTDGSGTITAADRQQLGSGLPRQLLSLTQQLTLGRASLDAQLDGMFGYQLYNVVLAFLNVGSSGLNSSGQLRDRWQPTNTDTDVPAADPQSRAFSSRELQSGSHVRLTNLRLSFQVWQQAARQLSVWAGGQNLLVLSAYRGFDPNVSSGGADNTEAGLDYGAYPVPRTVSVGIRATL